MIGASADPASEPIPPIAGDDADRGRSQAELVRREEQVRRPEDAPQDVRAAVRQGQRAEHRRARDDPHPVSDLAEHGLAVGMRRRWRLLLPDRPEEQRRDHERHGVDGDRDRGREQLDEEPADPERAELCDRTRRSEGAVRRDEPLAWDDGRQVGVVRDVEERREDGSRERDEQELRHARAGPARPPRESSRAGRPGRGRPRSGSAGGSSRSTHAPAKSPTIRPAISSTDRSAAISSGTGVEDEDRRERQRGPRDERPEDRDRARRPDRDEAAVAPQRAASSVWAVGHRSSTRKGSGASERRAGVARWPHARAVQQRTVRGAGAGAVPPRRRARGRRRRPQPAPAHLGARRRGREPARQRGGPARRPARRSRSR